MEYSNPRKQAVFEDWPFGRSLRCRATFTIEGNGRGERCSRVTIDPRNGRTCKPKTTIYGRKARIVDGSDGRTYIIMACSVPYIDMIHIIQSDLVHGSYLHGSSGDQEEVDSFHRVSTLFREEA